MTVRRTTLVFGIGAVLLLLLLPRAIAFEVESFSIECKNQQEPANDNIYVVIEVNGKDMEFDPTLPTTQSGMHKLKARNMSRGNTWNFDAALLKELKFDKSLKITVFERDGIEDDKFGATDHITGAGADTKVLNGSSIGGLGDFSYEIKYKVKP